MRIRKRSRRRTAGRIAATALTTAALVVTVQAPAGATPAQGVTGTIISQRTVGDTDYILRKLVVQPGGTTGWHYHDGTLHAVVTKGTFTHHAADCSVDGLYRPGGRILEPSGSDHVHLGRNLGSAPVELTVLYVLPHGSPLSQDAPNPGCSFE